MLYPILLDYYLYFCFALLAITWFGRGANPSLRTNLFYGYGLISALGFLLALDWMGGVIFGLILLELGRHLRRWLDKKAAQLKK
ncbi:hypothetical protein A9Q77_12170 [Marinomonas sp. 42_23_T18]|nr:hypothetical protein A9Q77_12170 [Marinomonas sp. 42_23_T18]